MGKRIRHPGGLTEVTQETNAGGEWKVYADPDNILIDSYHAGLGPHIHDPDDYDARTPLPGMTAAVAYDRVVAHLHRNGGVDFRRLLEELKRED